MFWSRLIVERNSFLRIGEGEKKAIVNPKSISSNDRYDRYIYVAGVIPFNSSNIDAMCPH